MELCLGELCAGELHVFHSCLVPSSRKNLSVQHVTLCHVPVDVLPRLFLWFSQVKHFYRFHMDLRKVGSTRVDEPGSSASVSYGSKSLRKSNKL